MVNSVQFRRFCGGGVMLGMRSCAMTTRPCTVWLSAAAGETLAILIKQSPNFAEPFAKCTRRFFCKRITSLMAKPTDVRPLAVSLYFLPVQTRVPLKFGTGTVTSVICARARLTVSDKQGRVAAGWGETPLSVQWVWPSEVSFEERQEALKRFCVLLAKAWTAFDGTGHALEVGHNFQEHALPGLLQNFNRDDRAGRELMPWLAALVCCSIFDQALHDAYGQVHQRYVYEMYGPEFLSRDLSSLLAPADGAAV